MYLTTNNSQINTPKAQPYPNPNPNPKPYPTTTNSRSMEQLRAAIRNQQ